MVVGAWYGRGFALAGAAAAVVPAIVMWGFTVDDALIPLRYAHHIAVGVGYRFDVHGPVTDGVTPLPWAPMLAVLARGHDLVLALERVKILGIAIWALAAAALGHELSRASRTWRHASIALAVVALAFPIGAYAASGMETPIATALATLAATRGGRSRLGAGLAGLGACFRPELVVWALAFTVSSSLGYRGKETSSSTRRGILTVALAIVPFATCAVIRLVAFGRAAPLSVLAKPSDVHHGATYAFAACVVLLLPVLSFAPIALWRASPRGKALAAAFLAHVLVVIAVGGDWMPYARLFVPVAPSLALVFVDVGRVAHALSTGARTIVVLVVGGWVARTAAPAGRHVHDDRKELIAHARPCLSSSSVVAALDVGWAGAATDADVVDLAGLTDPSIAVLPGGHTSKAVDVSMLLERNVDTVLVYSTPRIVEQRLLRSPLFHERYWVSVNLAFGGNGASYAIYRRR